MNCVYVCDSLCLAGWCRMIQFVMKPHFIRVCTYLFQIIYNVCFKQKSCVRRCSVKLKQVRIIKIGLS